MPEPDRRGPRARRLLVLAVTAAGLLLQLSTAHAVRPTQPPPDDPARPRVLIQPPVVPYGAQVRIVVTGQVPGAAVVATVSDLRTVTPLGGVLDADGTVSWTIPATTNANVRADIGGLLNPDLVPLRVVRLATLRVRLDPRGHRFEGLTIPATPGLQVTVAKVLPGGRVVGVGAARTDASGRYSTAVRLAPGTHLYYAVTPSTQQLVAARSRLYGLRVPG